VRQREDKKKYWNENKLYKILELIFGRPNVIAGVHPLWAVSNKGALLEYDFGVLDKNLLIEYNGKQHYEYPNTFHKTKEQFLLQKGRDRIKESLAGSQGWKFLIFKYNEAITYETVYERLKRENIT
jgi:hypothetical protein